MSVPPMQPRPSRADRATRPKSAERLGSFEVGRWEVDREGAEPSCGGDPAIRRGAPATRSGSLAWAGYAASVWLIAYAVGVRGYQGLGGTVGLAGTFEDPAAMRQASLVAGGFLLVAGLGELVVG